MERQEPWPFGGRSTAEARTLRPMTQNLQCAGRPYFVRRLRRRCERAISSSASSRSSCERLQCGSSDTGRNHRDRRAPQRRGWAGGAAGEAHGAAYALDGVMPDGRLSGPFGGLRRRQRCAKHRRTFSKLRPLLPQQPLNGVETEGRILDSIRSSGSPRFGTPAARRFAVLRFPTAQREGGLCRRVAESIGKARVTQRARYHHAADA